MLTDCCLGQGHANLIYYLHLNWVSKLLVSNVWGIAPNAPKYVTGHDRLAKRSLILDQSWTVISTLTTLTIEIMSIVEQVIIILKIIILIVIIPSKV